MAEFFNDTTTSFYIILIVWGADQFDSICCHTRLSQKYWLRYKIFDVEYHLHWKGKQLLLFNNWFLAMFIRHLLSFLFSNPWSYEALFLAYFDFRALYKLCSTSPLHFRYRTILERDLPQHALFSFHFASKTVNSSLIQ